MTDPSSRRQHRAGPGGAHAAHPTAVQALLPAAFGELRRLVDAALDQPGTPFEPRALVAAAASHLDRAGVIGKRTQHAFRVAAAIALRQILVGCAGQRPIVLVPEVRAPVLTLFTADRVLLLDAGLAALAATQPRAASVAEVRLFGAASPDQIALGLEWPLGEVTRDWAFAKAWLWRRMTGRAAVGTIES